MAASLYAFICVCTIVIESISAQCIGNALAAEEFALANNALAYGPGLAANSLAYGAPCGGIASNYALNGFVPSSGGGFAVTSSSPIAPTGITVVSENAIEGALNVIGELPFLSAVALEGALPTAGAGGINYGCGSGAIGIASETVAPAYGAPAYGPPIAPAAALGPARFGAGIGPAAFGAPGLAASGLVAPGLAGPGFAAGLAGPGYGYNGLAGGCGFGALY